MRKEFIRITNTNANDKEWLLEQYIVNQKSINEIAIECKITADSVTRRINKFGIPLRNHKEALALKNKKFPNTPSDTAIEKHREQQKTGHEILCKNCGNSFYVNKKSKKLFCSKKCNLEYLKNNRKEINEWHDTPEYKEWRKLVYERDGYRCVICGSRDINAHHIIPGMKNKELRYVVSNGITLCVEHHKQAHRSPNK